MATNDNILWPPEKDNNRTITSKLRWTVDCCLSCTTSLVKLEMNWARARGKIRCEPKHWQVTHWHIDLSKAEDMSTWDRTQYNVPRMDNLWAYTRTWKKNTAKSGILLCQPNESFLSTVAVNRYQLWSSSGLNSFARICLYELKAILCTPYVWLTCSSVCMTKGAIQYIRYELITTERWDHRPQAIVKWFGFWHRKDNASII